MTYTYKHTRDLEGNTGEYFLRKEDNAFIPVDPENIDYQEFKKWLDAGNTPDPA